MNEKHRMRPVVTRFLGDKEEPRIHNSMVSLGKDYARFCLDGAHAFQGKSGKWGIFGISRSHGAYGYTGEVSMSTARDTEDDAWAQVGGQAFYTSWCENIDEVAERVAQLRAELEREEETLRRLHDRNNNPQLESE